MCLVSGSTNACADGRISFIQVMTMRRNDRPSWYSRLAPPRPFLFLVCCYLVGILFFALFRAAFLIEFHDSMQEAAMIDFVRAFLVGWRFDQIVVLCMLMPLALLVFWTGVQAMVVRVAVLSFLSVVFSAATILLLADLRFFKYMQSHLNFQAVLYMSEGGRTTRHLIVSEPRFMLNMILWVAMTAALVIVFVKVLRFTRRFPERRSWLGQVAWFVVYLALTALGIRGRTSLSPLDWGAAYFSDNHFLNQSALNGIYTLGRAFTEEGRDPRLVYLRESERFPFLPFQTGLDSVKTMLGSRNDTWLEPERSLLRTTKQPDAKWGFKPNIVLVLMESWSGRYTGSLGAADNLTPHFDSLAAHGILFTNFYAAGTRTNYGLSAVLCSFPSIPGRAIINRYNANHPFVSLSELLHDRAYTNLFVYGGDLVFDNMKGFLTTRKYDRFYGDRELGPQNVFSKWGIPDRIVFHEAAAIAAFAPRPFQMTILTISDHEPFDLPDSSVRRYFDNSEPSRIRNAQVYADFALGLFMHQMQSMPAFDSTIFVFTSDHALWGYGRMHPDPTDYHIPLLIYSPKLLGGSGRRVPTIGGQVDLLPILMGLLGGDYTHQSWGRNLLDSAVADGGFAVTNSTTRFGLTEDGFLYAETLGRPPALYRFADSGLVLTDVKRDCQDEFQRLQRRLRTYLQVADQMSTPAAPAR